MSRSSSPVRSCRLALLRVSGAAVAGLALLPSAGGAESPKYRRVGFSGKTSQGLPIKFQLALTGKRLDRPNTFLRDEQNVRLSCDNLTATTRTVAYARRYVPRPTATADSRLYPFDWGPLPRDARPQFRLDNTFRIATHSVYPPSTELAGLASGSGKINAAHTTITGMIRVHEVFHLPDATVHRKAVSCPDFVVTFTARR